MKSIITILLFVILFSGCDNLFSTREAEPPKTQRSTWNPPFSPDIVLDNLKNAILERNVENFVKCLIDTAYSNRTYVFTPNDQVLSSHLDLFLVWNRYSEQLAIQQMFSIVPEDSLAYLQYPSEIRNVVTADSAIFDREYHLEIHHIQPELPTVYEGRMELWIAPDEKGEWAIYRWIDYSATDYASWSFLKASLGG